MQAEMTATDPGTTVLALFGCGGKRLALPATSVTRGVPLPELLRPPELPEHTLGMLRLGETVIPIIELAGVLGLDTVEQDVHDPILIVKMGDDEIGLLVEDIEGVAAVDNSAFRRVPRSRSLNDCVSASVSVHGRQVSLLDPDRLLLAEERLRLRSLRDRAEARVRSVGGGRE